MRYLLEKELLSVLYRGKSVEQFLGYGSTDKTIRWIELRPKVETSEVWLFEVENIGSNDYLDVYSFPEVDGSNSQALVTLQPEKAIQYCYEELNAIPTCWVNQGVIQDEYANLLSQN
ncbi:hypothetical protein [Agitococcus lubricus]|uniref:Uncharacterized protein n=1 Tax=Agitococcus lubricus TaxID=1077255 RepID=A0A2T5IZL3_9GAMM|nr:hypothetical protein [Agitococcus lubricus]PTQ89472.1 hypothetical protein C8N29_1063 [Agitococcus lubricus]